MAAKRNTPAPKTAQPAILEAEGATTKRASSCPLDVKGAPRDRLHCANLGVWQIQTLLDAALDEVPGDDGDEPDPDRFFVLRALLARASRLSQATAALLGESGDATPTIEAEIEAAMQEVNHG